MNFMPSMEVSKHFKSSNLAPLSSGMKEVRIHPYDLH
jgi:hypothetical protein